MNEEQKVTEVETAGRSERSRIVSVLSSTVKDWAVEGRRGALIKTGCWEEQSTNGYADSTLSLSVSLLHFFLHVCELLVAMPFLLCFYIISIIMCSSHQKERGAICARGGTFCPGSECQCTRLSARGDVKTNWSNIKCSFCPSSSLCRDWHLLSSLLMKPATADTSVFLLYIKFKQRVPRKRVKPNGLTSYSSSAYVLLTAQ